MRVYLGEEKLGETSNPFAKYSPKDWAFYFMEQYGQIDGDHHKAWVLDQVARCLHGTQVIISVARWSDGKEEYRCQTAEPSKEYLAWVETMRFPYGPDGEEYDYSVGIPP